MLKVLFFFSVVHDWLKINLYRNDKTPLCIFLNDWSNGKIFPKSLTKRKLPFCLTPTTPIKLYSLSSRCLSFRRDHYNDGSSFIQTSTQVNKTAASCLAQLFPIPDETLLSDAVHSNESSHSPPSKYKLQKEKACLGEHCKKICSTRNAIKNFFFDENLHAHLFFFFFFLRAESFSAHF